MEILTVGEFKARFSEMLKEVSEGKEIGITYGRNKKLVAKLVPGDKKAKRKLGLLKGEAQVVFSDDFEITEEEFSGL